MGIAAPIPCGSVEGQRLGDIFHGPVGVGIMIAHDPLHRSQRAALPHWAPALGDDEQALRGIGVCTYPCQRFTPGVTPDGA